MSQPVNGMSDIDSVETFFTSRYFRHSRPRHNITYSLASHPLPSIFIPLRSIVACHSPLAPSTPNMVAWIPSSGSLASSTPAPPKTKTKHLVCFRPRTICSLSFSFQRSFSNQTKPNSEEIKRKDLPPHPPKL